MNEMRHALRNHTLKLHRRREILKETLAFIVVLSMAGAIGAMMAIAI